MLNFSIMPLDEKHIEEICQDIAYQVNSGVATMPLFNMTLTPEGKPTIDKADIYCKVYEKFKEKLDAMGVPSGVLIQASIGHGWKLNEQSVFQKYTNLSNGSQPDVYCPLDEGFKEYIRASVARIAMTNLHHIMLDDDFRLMGRPGHGCACPLHLDRLKELTGRTFTREQVLEAVNNNKTDDEKLIREAFVNTQIDSLIECAKEIRNGIDSINPKIPGSFSFSGYSAEGAYEIAEILAGEGNPVVIRVNNANYCAENPRTVIGSFHNAATEIQALTKKPDILLAETDTCPQNRYSTPANKLHTHFTFSILEGISGAKHWITRLHAYEPNSGIAYRKKLAKYSEFYKELIRITPQLTWLGCKIPVSPRPFHLLSASDVDIVTGSYGWCMHVLDRFGIPMHFSNKCEGVTFFDGKRDKFFTDEELLEFLSGNIVLDAAAAESFIDRGFSKYLGVNVKKREKDAKNVSGEIIYPNGEFKAQYDIHEIIPLSKEVKVYSDAYHLRDGKYRDILFPSVTAFKNQLGGTVVVYAGITTFAFDIRTAFGFLNETRKAQLVKILQDMDSLPVYYPDDAEVFLKAAKTEDGKLFCAILDMSLDSIEEFPLICENKIKSVKCLKPDGSYENVNFETIDGRTQLDITVYPFDPVILIIE